MAKPLVFRLAGAELPVQLTKVDRAKLYGFKEVEVLDDHQRKCELATLGDDGRTVVARGGVGLGYLSADGEWREKADLRAIDAEGNPIQPVPSSYAAPVELSVTATIADYLSHNIRSLYQLEGEVDLGPLRAELAAGKIFKFPYSFRGGLEADAGFLLLSEDGSLFMAIGNPTKAEFIGLQQVAVAEEDFAEEEEADLMDFGMM